MAKVQYMGTGRRKKSIVYFFTDNYSLYYRKEG